MSTVSVNAEKNRYPFSVQFFKVASNIILHSVTNNIIHGWGPNNLTLTS